MIRSEAVPYFAAAAVLAIVVAVAFFEPLVPRLRRELADFREGVRQMPALVRESLSVALVAVDAWSERANASRNGAVDDGQRAELEASIGQELDREARQS